jgi:hypothetical protein
LETSLKEAAVSRMVVISSTDNSLMPKRSFRLNANVNQLSVASRQLSVAVVSEN